MSVNGLYRGFFPKGVAVIGAPEENFGSWGRRTVENLAAGGFKGEIFPVFPQSEEIAGLKNFPDLAAIKGQVDLAFWLGPLSGVPKILQDCKRAGVGCLVVPARNYKSLALLKKIYQEARETGVRLFGPRSWGVVNPWVNLNGSLGSQMPQTGRLAVVSQSATFCSSIIDLSLDRKIGLSILVGLGDMLDVDFADAIDYLANHFRVGAILLHVESLTNMRKFMSAARAASMMKPIVALKTGRFHSSGSKAFTGTGSLITEDGIYDSAFKRAGIIRVETIEDLFDCGALLGKQPRPLGPNLAVMANSRTPGIMAMDSLSAGGLPRAVFKSRTIAALDQIAPQGWGENNPITLDPQAPVEVYVKIMETCLADPDIDGLLIIVTPQFLSEPQNLSRALVRAANGKKAPVIVVWMGGRAMGPARSILEEAGLPVYESPERAVRAFLNLYEFDRNLKMLQEIPPALPSVFAENKEKARKIIEADPSGGRRVLTGLQSLELLRAYDLPVLTAEIAQTAEEAVLLAKKMGQPVMLRQEENGPYSAIRPRTFPSCLFGLEEVKEAYNRLAGLKEDNGKAGGPVVVVQPAYPQPAHVLRLGCRQLRPFGPIILFGQAGLPPEASIDQALGLPPLNRLLARRIIEQTRVFTLLTSPGEDPEGEVMEHLTKMLVNLSHLVTDFPEINELEISPVYLVEGRPVIQWARVVLEPAEDPPPMHLIISPYPDEYESTARTRAGLDIFIRPIRPEDSNLLRELWSILSPRTIYYRFSRPVKELTPELLVRFTQIDYDREMALVALMTEGKHEKMLAVARLFGQPEALLAEFAVVVGDPWQGMGVGAQLLRKLFIIAAKRRIGKLWGLVLRENVVMLELARKVGCRVVKSDDPSQVEVTLDLTEETVANLLATET